MEYVFYITDESFDYDGPFGTMTQHVWGKHGFEFDGEDISSLKGFGELHDIEEDIKDFSDLKKFIEENYDKIQFTDELSQDENRMVFMDLAESLK